MSNEEREMMLDLLCDKFVYGLSEEEARKLEELGYDPAEAESIELTIAALSTAEVGAETEMPASLQQKLASAAANQKAVMVPAEAEPAPVPQREIVLSGGRGSWFGWLGWAAAAAASGSRAARTSRSMSECGNRLPRP